MALFVLLVWLLVCYIDIPHNKADKRLWLMFVPALFMMGTRDVSVGLDTYQYSVHFENDMVASWSELLTTKDFLYEALMKLSGYVIGDYYFFQILYSLAYFTLYSYFIRKNCSNILLSALIFMCIGLFSWAMNIQRQMFSIAIVVAAWTYINQNKNKIGIALYVLACLIHASTIVFLPFIILTRFRLKPWMLKILPIVLMAVLLCYSMILPFVGMYMPMYEQYTNDSMEMAHGGNMVVFLWGLELCLAIIIFYSEKIDYSDRIACLGVMFYVGANFLGYRFPYAERIGLVGFPFTILIFDNIYRILPSVRIKRFYAGCAVICFLIYLCMSLSTEELTYRPFCL